MARFTRIELDEAPSIHDFFIQELLFSEFDDRQVAGVVRPGLVAAAKIASNRIKKNIRSRTGNLRRGVRTRYQGGGARTNVRRFDISASFTGRFNVGEAQVYVGPPGFHWHLVEYGHAIVTRDGRVVGQVPPHPFIVPGIVDTQERQLAAAVRAMRKSFARLVG